MRKLIDKYVKNIGIKQRVEEISILSNDFPRQMSKYISSKSKASAMEHAIRYHIKVTLENKDPGLYSRFKDRLESIIQNYQGNWEQMLVELEELKKDISKGRAEDPRFTHIQLPFYDLLKLNIPSEVSPDMEDKLVKTTKDVCADIAESLSIAYFWEKSNEIEELKGKIHERLRLGSQIPVLKENYANIADKIILLAKNNYSEILRYKNEMAKQDSTR